MLIFKTSVTVVIIAFFTTFCAYLMYTFVAAGHFFQTRKGTYLKVTVYTHFNAYKIVIAAVQHATLVAI